MSKIELTDSVHTIVMKMCDGNPGAIAALMDIVAKGATIDPQAIMGGLGAILLLDTWGIYGSSIYVLWSDKCDKDTRKLLVLLRATQLGLMTDGELQKFAADQCREHNLTDEEFNELDEQVCARLDQFQKAA